ERRGVAQAVPIGERDRGVEGVVPTREVDRLEGEQRPDAVGGIRTAVEGAWLQLGVADRGVVAVGEHVVVAEDVDVARGVDDTCADRSGSDRRVADGEAQRRGTRAQRGSAEGDEHPRDLGRDGHPVEQGWQATDTGLRYQDLYGHLTAGEESHRRADD